MAKKNLLIVILAVDYESNESTKAKSFDQVKFNFKLY